MTPPLWRRVLRMHGPDPRADVRDEFAFHIEERTESLIGHGLSPADAHDVAVKRFGDIAGATAECASIGTRRVRGVQLRERFDSVLQDLGYAVKAMRRSPGFAVATVSTIALGIGANTAVFSLLNALLLQPLDAAQPRELVRIYTSESGPARTPRDLLGATSYPDYVAFGRSRSLSGVAAYMPMSANIPVQGQPSRFQARLVSENFFGLLGRPLLRGGWLGGAGPEAIVSHRFWTTQLDGDSAVIGRTLLVNGVVVRVAGITRADFLGIEPSNIDLYVPIRWTGTFTGRSGFLTDRGERSLRLVGRLADGANAQTAERELSATMRALGSEFPESNAKRTVTVRPAPSIIPMEVAGNAVIPLAVLVFGATLVMLAIAGVNVAAVLLARTVRRRREVAVRLSLGASPLRLVRQLVTESVLLAVVAGVVVIGLVALLPALATQLGVPRSVQPIVDLTVLAYAAAVAIASGVLFGLAPALTGIKGDVVDALRTGEGGPRRGKARTQRLLVGAQLALSMLLLAVGGALLRSLDRQQRVDPGFMVERLLVATFEDPSGRVDAGRERTFTQLAIRRLGGVPGIRFVSTASMAPLTGDGMRSTTDIPGYTPAPDEKMEIPVVVAGPELFRTLGIPLRRGRELTWADRDTMPKIVVNELMARRYWGARDPVGRFVTLGGNGGTQAEVIGVSANARFISLAESPVPMYVVQRTSGGGESLLIRTTNDAATMLLAVRGIMSRSDLPLTMVRLESMEEVLQTSLGVTRAISATLLTIGLLAVLLATIGLYGVVSYVMAGRTREFGVRLALGATAGSITRLVLVYGLRLSLVGGLIGLALGLVAITAMGPVLFGAAESLPTIVVTAVVLCGVTLLACAVPALRATSASPATALRAD